MKRRGEACKDRRPTRPGQGARRRDEKTIDATASYRLKDKKADIHGQHSEA